MGPTSSPAATPSRFPRILIAEDTVSSLEDLLPVFTDPRIDLDYELCTSVQSDVSKLLATPYQIIVSGAWSFILKAERRTCIRPRGVQARLQDSMHRADKGHPARVLGYRRL